MHAEIVTTGETFGRMNNWNEWDPPIRATYVQECVRLLAASETRGARDAIHQSWNDPSPEVRAAGSKWEEIINEENGEELELDLSLSKTSHRAKRTGSTGEGLSGWRKHDKECHGG